MAFTTIFPESANVSDMSSEDIESYEPIVVLELFTSQGCSSCPPADALLDKVKKEYDDTVYALSYHVDYWNYIGWDDPFSSSKFTEKQREYNLKLKSRSNYTPELVVNGKEHFVGSDASKVNRAIQEYKKLKTANKVSLSNVHAEQKNISFDFGILGDVKGKNLRAVLVIDQSTTEVKRGENRNRTLTNSNIVVAEKSLKIDGIDGKSYMAIPEIVKSDEKISLMLLAENSDHDISGAAKTVVRR